MNELLISLQHKLDKIDCKSLDFIEGFATVFEELVDYIEVHDDNTMHKILVNYMKKDIESLLRTKKSQFNFITK